MCHGWQRSSLLSNSSYGKGALTLFDHCSVRDADPWRSIKCLQAMIALHHMLSSRDQRGPISARWKQLQRYQSKLAEEMAQCLRIQRQSYGLKYIPSQIVDATEFCFRVLVWQLENSDGARLAFIELCRFAVALSERFQGAAVTIQRIQSLAQSQTLRLPPEAINILDDAENWKGIDP